MEYREFASIVYHKKQMHADTLWILYRTPMIIITARRSYASAVLGVVILSVCLSHVCFVTNPKNLPVIFLYHILIVNTKHAVGNGLSK